ncbi:hypothetical protein TNCV_1775291 [Trichonephila clavipes]|nr:hypothetical protein TNCV_1775291 [Trichonephila clavipes]
MYQANGLHCEAMDVLPCPKPIPKVTPVRPKHNTAFVGLTRVNDQEEPTRWPFGNKPRHFEPWSSDEDDTRAVNTFFNYHTIPTGGCLSSRQI